MSVAIKNTRMPAVEEAGGRVASSGGDDEDVGEVAGERNPATLHEVLAGVDEEVPVRNKPSRRRCWPHGGRQLSWW